MNNSETFENYKKCEKQALEIAETLTQSGHRIEDIEIALIAAIFEAHKGKTLPHTVAKIINNHVSNIGGYYVARAKENGAVT